MKTTKLFQHQDLGGFTFILAMVLLCLCNCTSKPIELLAPETLETIEQEDEVERFAVGVTFLYATDNQRVWSNLTWYPDMTWETSPLGEIYPNTTDWMKAEWRPTDNVFEFYIKPEMVGFSNIEIKEEEDCGTIEQTKLSEQDGFQVLTFSVDDDFVNCLDNTGHQIKLDLTILI